MPPRTWLPACHACTDTRGPRAAHAIEAVGARPATRELDRARALECVRLCTGDRAAQLFERAGRRQFPDRRLCVCAGRTVARPRAPDHERAPGDVDRHLRVCALVRFFGQLCEVRRDRPVREAVRRRRLPRSAAAAGCQRIQRSALSAVRQLPWRTRAFGERVSRLPPAAYRRRERSGVGAVGPIRPATPRQHRQQAVVRQARVGSDFTYFAGGRGAIDGVPQNDFQQNWRVGATLALPIDARNSIKVYASSGVSARTGNNFDLIGTAWQFRWGDGL